MDKNIFSLIDKYYADNAPLREILIVHSKAVVERALSIAHKHPEFHVDEQFLYEAAMWHDIGIFLTDAPGIFCHGSEPYIRHGILGAELLRNEGYPAHARVAERHTGTGLTVATIQTQHLPLPLQDFVPETIEEQIICYADKFYSKTRLTETKTYEQAYRSLIRFSPDTLERLQQWHELFENNQ